MPSFASLLGGLRLQIKDSESTRGLRECQIGAYWATLAHFTASDRPALIVLPTGAGKTALAMLLSIGLHAGRVLIITPAVVLRDQTARKCRGLDDLIAERILPKNTQKPRVHVQETRVTSPRGWSRLKSFDLVVATTHTISPEQHEDIVPPPDDLFDLVFFDEAHHTPAPTWTALMGAFRKSRVILLTATPFREDKRRLQADIVYNYPIGRAIDKGVYEPIRYHRVLVALGADKDAALCSTAHRILSAERTAGRSPRLLIRANRVNRTPALLKLYESRGMKLGEVNYSRNLDHNETVLKRVRTKELDGVVCIGMIGEGLDIPELKIAVFHDPPQSFPFTLQFIGRISRTTPSGVGPAHLIASPDDVRGEIRRLYLQDVRWRDLIPKLVDEVIADITAKSRPMSSDADGPAEIDPHDISPFFSARIYRVLEQQLGFQKAIDLGEKTSITFDDQLFDNAMRVLVTHTETKPAWGARLNLHTSQVDLHVYYYNHQAKALFEYTTANALAAAIREQLIGGDYRRFGGAELARVLKTQARVDYLMLGLANVLGRNPSLPAYKILMGRDVKGSLRASEGMVFSPGHALVRISDQEVRGIANFQGRVWAIKRATLADYKAWCDVVARGLRNRVHGLPELEFFPSPQPIHRFAHQPVGIIPHHGLLGVELEVAPADAGIGVRTNTWEFEVGGLSNDGTRLKTTLVLTDQLKVHVTYDLRTNRWIDDGGHLVRFDAGQGPVGLKLQEFLTEFPPYIYIGDGSMVVGGRCTRQGRHWLDFHQIALCRGSTGPIVTLGLSLPTSPEASLRGTESCLSMTGWSGTS